MLLTGLISTGKSASRKKYLILSIEINILTKQSAQFCEQNWLHE